MRLKDFELKLSSLLLCLFSATQGPRGGAGTVGSEERGDACPGAHRNQRPRPVFGVRQELAHRATC